MKIDFRSQFHVEFLFPDRINDLARGIQDFFFLNHIWLYDEWPASYLVAHICSDKIMGWELGSNVLKYFTFGFVWQE